MTRNKIGQSVEDLNAVVADVQSFAADNREALGTASDKLASISQALIASLDDLKQTLHVAPTTFANFNNIYEPANGALTGALAINNFANPIAFLCGAIQAASPVRGPAGSETLCAVHGADIQEPPVQLSADRGEPGSSAPRHDPTRSPTARTGCGPTTFRQPRIHRRQLKRPLLARRRRRLRMHRGPPKARLLVRLPPRQ